MGDYLITIVTIILAAILLFVFPMITIADRTDDISQIAVQTATVDFVDSVRETGKITPDNYGDFIEKINSTGNTYTVDLELRRLDENPSKKTASAEPQKIGENTYYSIYTTQIENELNSGTLYLKQGDMFSAGVINSNQTLAEVLKNFFYQVTGNSANTITAKHAGVVMIDGQ